MVENINSEEFESAPNRQNLVDTAVNFLLNHDVKNKPEHTKVGFLKKKGLTDAEISEAFSRVKADPRYPSIPTQSDLQPLIYPQKSYSFWSQLSRFSSSFIVIAVALYGLHRFYKLYIEPWLFGTKSEAEQQSDMKNAIFELNNSILELKNTVSSLEMAVTAQKKQIDAIFVAEGSPYMPIPLAVAELKTEIGAVKSLLINRHQFPAMPKVTPPSIPLWQLPQSQTGNTEEPSKVKSPEENGLDPTFSEPEGETIKKLQTKSDSENSSIESYFDPAVTLGSLESIQNGTNGTSLDDNSTDC